MPRLGQHFLKNTNALLCVARSLSLLHNDTVVEIGPGHGELTQHLIDFGARVIAIEKDPSLVKNIRASFPHDRCEVIEGDVRDVLPSLVQARNLSSYYVTGNIPYYITGIILSDIGNLEVRPRICSLTIQKEVAERACEDAPRMNRLSASLRFWADPYIIQVISRKDFSPQPKVDSATLLLKSLPHSPCSRKIFDFALDSLFFQPRKTVLNNLKTTKIPSDIIISTLEEAGVSSMCRPQDLDVADIARIGTLLVAQLHAIHPHK